MTLGLQSTCITPRSIEKHPYHVNIKHWPDLDYSRYKHHLTWVCSPKPLCRRKRDSRQVYWFPGPCSWWTSVDWSPCTGFRTRPEERGTGTPWRRPALPCSPRIHSRTCPGCLSGRLLQASSSTRLQADPYRNNTRLSERVCFTATLRSISVTCVHEAPLLEES